MSMDEYPGFDEPYSVERLEREAEIEFLRNRVKGLEDKAKENEQVFLEANANSYDTYMRLMAALRKYGGHLDDCEVDCIVVVGGEQSYEGRCTCGYGELIGGE